MMGAIGGLPVELLQGFGAGSLVALVAVLIFLGRLYPRSWVREIREDRDAWRKAHDLVELARQVQGKQLDELLRHAETQNRLGEAMAATLERIERERERERERNPAGGQRVGP